MPRRADRAERALWHAAMRGVAPLDPSRAIVEPEAPKAPPPAAVSAKPPPPAPAKPAADLGPGPGIDRATETRFRLGQMPVQARLDLHGMTEAAAHAALAAFLERNWHENRRVLLVITGKGSAGGGVLRRAVPRWLAEPAAARRILAMAPAQPRHGGEGALYLLLRRRRA